MKQEDAIQTISIREKILIIRNIPVLIDRDLANMYAVETKRINEQARRNIERFPARYRFQLSNNEKEELVANCDRFNQLKHSTANPYAYTEQGVAMLATVLKSDIAVKVSISIMDAFVAMRRIIASSSSATQRLYALEHRQLHVEQQIQDIFQLIENQHIPPKQGIFFNGQVFDAYGFVSDLIRSAKSSITIVDNYADDSVLTQLTKRGQGVSACICVGKISEGLLLDTERHNRQYDPVTLREVHCIHDRFLLIDDTRLYQFGASFKDLGRKLFCFTVIESKAIIDSIRMLCAGKDSESQTINQ